MSSIRYDSATPPTYVEENLDPLSSASSSSLNNSRALSVHQTRMISRARS